MLGTPEHAALNLCTQARLSCSARMPSASHTSKNAEIHRQLVYTVLAPFLQQQLANPTKRRSQPLHSTFRVYDTRAKPPNAASKPMQKRSQETITITFLKTANVKHVKHNTMGNHHRDRQEYPPTGSRVEAAPECVSVMFDESSGLATKITGGFCMDRGMGNTGPAGGIWGVLQVCTCMHDGPRVCVCICSHYLCGILR